MGSYGLLGHIGVVTRNRLRMGSIETAISKTMDVLEGAYSLVIKMCIRDRMIATVRRSGYTL